MDPCPGQKRLRRLVRTAGLRGRAADANKTLHRDTVDRRARAQLYLSGSPARCSCAHPPPLSRSPPRRAPAPLRHPRGARNDAHQNHLSVLLFYSTDYVSANSNAIMHQPNWISNLGKT